MAKKSSAIDFAGFEDQRLKEAQEATPLINALARPVARRTVDWQHSAEKISVGLSGICLLAAFGWRFSVCETIC